MNKIIGFLFSITLSVLSCDLNAQIKENLKFGNPTTEELTMDSYAAEPEANAVVLCDLSTVYYDLMNYNFVKMEDRKTRIKVLKQEGTEYANVTIKYHKNAKGNDNLEDVVSKIDAVAYNMENGKMVSTKMKSDLIFRERLDDDFMVVKFTIPQVKVGTVIEYQYRIKSDNIYYIADWYAQHEIPVLYTKYDLNIPEYYNFHIENTGYAELQHSVKESNKSYNLGDANSLFTSKDVNHVFIGQQIPSMKEDDYTWSTDDYRAKVTAELQSVQFPNSRFIPFTTTWEEVAKTLIEHENFGKRIGNNTPLKEEIDGLNLAQMETVNDKVSAIFKLLMSKVKWDGEYALLSEKKANQALKDGTGSNADINFMLINMLNSNGIEAWPLALRKRNVGRLPVTHPSVGRLSTFVVAFNNGNDEISVIDASSAEGYIDVLRPHLMVEKAMLVKKDGISWLNLADKCKGREITSITAELKADGTVVGKRSKSMYYECSLLYKRDNKDNDSIKMIERISDKLEATVKDYSVSNINEFTPSVAENISFEKKVDGSGDVIYLNPFIFPIWNTNPFTQEVRELPIECSYTCQEDFHTILSIPEGYDVEELPAPMQIQTSDKAITCVIRFSKQDNVITSSYQYRLKRLLFLPEEYEGLKEIYENVVSKCNEMIAVKKK